jgi:putative endonuclease
MPVGRNRLNYGRQNSLWERLGVRGSSLSENVRYGTPEETVSKSKQKRILATASHYFQKHSLEDRAMRFDVVAITWPNYAPSVTWIPEAFS